MESLKGADVGEARHRLVRRLRAGLVTPSPGGPGSPSVPTKGTALNGWTRRGRRVAKAARIGEGAALPSAPVSYGPGDRNRRDGAPRGARPSPRTRTPQG